MMFKVGSKYSRKDIGEIYFPGVGRPSGGMWDTGYVRVNEDLVVFMNIGLPGRTGHDFDNSFDANNHTITWFGKPNTNSRQPIFAKLKSGEYTPYFFARWDANPDFTYLGIGKVISMEDGYPTTDGGGNPCNTVKVLLSIKDADEVLTFDNPPSVENEAPSFILEKHLEDFIVNNWHLTLFSDDYDIYEENGVIVGQQFQTLSGPCDILAISKDKKEFLVIEMKKGRANDQVIGQITRYMGVIKDTLAANGQNVRGCIIAYEHDQNLKYALSMVPNLDCYAYRLKFDLEKIEAAS